jgi:uncharacterized iron-regulated membrane protein
MTDVSAGRPRRAKNWLYLNMKAWHSWGGLLVSAFLVVVGLTGFLLNHKKTFLEAAPAPSSPQMRNALRTTTRPDSLPMSFDRALILARSYYGDVPLEKVELKNEAGVLVFKVAPGAGREVRIDAQTGAMTSKYGMSLDRKDSSQWNWAKLVEDLHTGKLFGLTGVLLADLTALALIALTGTGIVLWALPRLRRKHGRDSRANRARNGVLVASIDLTSPPMIVQPCLSNSAQQAIELASSLPTNSCHAPNHQAGV